MRRNCLQSTHSAVFYFRVFFRIALDLFLGDFERENIDCSSLMPLPAIVCVSRGFVYTGTDMQQFFNNRYVQLAGLTLGVGALFFASIWIVTTVLGMTDFPIGLEVLLAFLGAGAVVYKFLSRRVM